MDLARALVLSTIRTSIGSGGGGSSSSSSNDDDSSV